MREFDYSKMIILVRDDNGKVIKRKEVAAERTVKLVVKPNEKYGEARAGDCVIVSEEEAENPTTKSTCMTADEYDRSLDKPKPAPTSTISKVKAAVEAGLARMHMDALKRKFEAADAANELSKE